MSKLALCINLLLTLSSYHRISGFNLPRPLQVIKRDFQALTRRVTAYHILLPKSDEVALKLKQSIRNKAYAKRGKDDMQIQQPMYIVDAFNEAATKYSRCKDTASDGGLLGTLVPQGYCLAPELDRACFEVQLGEVSGPIESDFGYHLLLVEERTNCPKLDGSYTRIVRGGGPDGTDIEFKSSASNDENQDIFIIALQQIGFWIGVSFAGGIVAEIAAKAVGVFETLPWENQP